MTKESIKKLGADYRKRREALGITQAELARVANIGRQTLNHIENGKANPTLSTMDSINNALTKFEDARKNG